jgi:hypothetical protein
MKIRQGCSSDDFRLDAADSAVAAPQITAELTRQDRQHRCGGVGGIECKVHV